MNSREDEEFRDIRGNLSAVFQTRLSRESKSRIREEFFHRATESKSLVPGKKHRFTTMRNMAAALAGVVLIAGGLYTYLTSPRQQSVSAVDATQVAYTAGHLDAILFIKSLGLVDQSTLQFSGVFSSCKAGKVNIFKSLIELDGLENGDHQIGEYFYGSNGTLLESYRDQVSANTIVPYNNFVVRDWSIRPTMGKNTLKVYLDGKYIGYAVLYGV